MEKNKNSMCKISTSGGIKKTFLRYKRKTRSLPFVLCVYCLWWGGFWPACFVLRWVKYKKKALNSGFLGNLLGYIVFRVIVFIRVNFFRTFITCLTGKIAGLVLDCCEKFTL